VYGGYFIFGYTTG